MNKGAGLTRNSVPSKLGIAMSSSLVKVIAGIVVLSLGVLGLSFFGDDVSSSSPRDDFGESDGLRVASFNGEIFGDAKISNVGVDYYVDLISDYDLFFLLEIRDADGSSFWEVCDGLVGYGCLISERSGRSVSKEAVGMFFREDLEVSRLNEYEGGSLPLNGSVGSTLVENPFGRAPVWVDVGGVRYWVVHLSPENVYREMEALELAVGDGVGKIVVLGDMNADCDYYSGGVDFDVEDGWRWIIGDDADTASGFKDCAYDRIIVSDGVEVLGSGVVEIDARVSDHNLVWVSLE